MNLKKFAVQTLSGAGIFVLSAAPVLAVDMDLQNTTTGAGSTNTIDVEVEKENTTQQTNLLQLVTIADISNQTGRNRANNNGGDVEIVSGDIESDVKVDTKANKNVANVSCGCEDTIRARNSQTGANSTNEIKAKNKVKNDDSQLNEALLFTALDERNRTGRNRVNGNLGNASVRTGQIRSRADFITRINSNLLNK